MFCCECIGLNWRSYADYSVFIDDELIATRNHIAHGASLRFDEASLVNYREKVVELMRITQNEIENLVVSKAYLREP